VFCGVTHIGKVASRSIKRTSKFGSKEAPMPADPVAAGRKGGGRNTPAQQAARKRNGFQKVKPEAQNQTVSCRECQTPKTDDAAAPLFEEEE
jgi:hypothetical protein